MPNGKRSVRNGKSNLRRDRGIGELPGMNKTNSPHLVDLHVGHRVKTRRLFCKMSQVRLAKQLGLTFQQLQKYESGANRISASRLWEIAKILDVPVVWFFEEFDDGELNAQNIPDTEVLEIANMVQALPTKIRRPILLAFKSLASLSEYSDK